MSVLGFESPEKEQKQLPIERERKFLVTSVPEQIDLSQMDGEHIEQGYLANGSGKNTVRIRKKDNSFFWTVKQKYGSNPGERIELECEITEDQFDIMWPATEGRRIEKTRYEIPCGDSTIELDVFGGENAGKMLAEVEFSTSLDADFFTPPDWLGPEVTDDGRFSNSKISKSGFPEIPTIH